MYYIRNVNQLVCQGVSFIDKATKAVTDHWKVLKLRFNTDIRLWKEMFDVLNTEEADGRYAEYEEDYNNLVHSMATDYLIVIKRVDEETQAEILSARDAMYER